MTNQDHVVNFCGAARALAPQTKIMTDQELANVYEMTRMVMRLLEDVRKELVARCKTHGNAGGLILCPVNGGREITDMRAAYAALRDIIPKNEFLKACSISVTKLESAFIIAQKLKGTYRDDITSRQEFDQTLGPALSLRPERITLCKAPAQPSQPPQPPTPPFPTPSDLDDIL